ncbi:1-acyl-sn-glycerol-3-phosphate acyltransferase [Neisseria sp. HSC-16F19]|nr:lysophospholipid acyltransferase family protein [Neisseria sp. HSC-16F19]MCP2040490.1 1-acyl-sn-glycerol-3-phosphate acyltransferase [Neisseria sp. HSC-16F19]
MSRLRFAARLAAIGVCLGYGSLEMLLLFPFYSPRRKLCAIQLWSQRVLASCGVRLSVHGILPPAERGQMLVSNHISWLDIMAINAAFPGRFVAKDDVAKWPVIGYLATQARTVYVTRNRRAASNGNQLNHVTQALAEGDSVALFPEGTSSVGEHILPFKGSFFQAALDAQVPLVPVLCRYPAADGGSVNPALAYYGDISLWDSIRAIISQPQSRVEVHFLPEVAPQGSRQELARQLHRILSEAQQGLAGEAA